MSGHSSILQSSFTHTHKRFGESAGDLVSHWAIKKHKSHIYPVNTCKRYIDPDSAVTLGGTATYKIPSEGRIVHIALSQTYDQTTTADMSDYIGIVAPKEITIYTNGQQQQKYDYYLALLDYLSALPNSEAIANVLAQAGGSTTGSSSGAIACIAPIPTPFDYLYNENGLHAYRVKDIKINVEFNTATNCTLPTGTGGAFTTSPQLVVYYEAVGENIKNVFMDQPMFMHGFKYNTKTLNVVATATATDIDVAFSGNLQRLLISARLVSDVGTNKKYHILKEIGTLIDNINSTSEYIFKTKEEGAYDYQLHNHRGGFNSTLGYPYVLDYTPYVEGDNFRDNHSGGLHSNEVVSHKINVTHALGANAYIDVLALTSCNYIYSGQTLTIQD